MANHLLNTAVESLMMANHLLNDTAALSAPVQVDLLESEFDAPSRSTLLEAVFYRRHAYQVDGWVGVEMKCSR